jgi:hypothetical protein
MEEMMHKHLTIAALAGAILMNPVNGASAEPRTLVVAGVAGPFEQVFRTQVLAAFTAKTGISAEYAGGNAVDQIARMIAQKSSQQIDVFITDDGPMLQAIGAGLCGKIVSIPANDLIDLARYPDDLAVAFGLISGGMPTIPNTSRSMAGRSQPPGMISRMQNTGASWWFRHSIRRLGWRPLLCLLVPMAAAKPT